MSSSHNMYIQHEFCCLVLLWLYHMEKKQHGILYQYVDLSVNTNEWKLMLD